MHTLPLSFAFLTYGGYWRPVKWQYYSLKSWLYSVYSTLMITQLYFFAFCGMVDSFISPDVKTMSDKFALSISVVGVCCKVANLFLRRGKIIGVVNVLLEENCIPRDEQEKQIQEKFDLHARKLTIFCEILNESAAIFAGLAQFNKLFVSRTLPAAEWVPYDLSSDFTFTVTLIHQTIALMVCANTSVAHETLISGLMIQICAQLEILCHRARILPTTLNQAREQCKTNDDWKHTERQLIVGFIRHHLDIYRFALTVNEVFNLMIFMQFCISSTVLCLSIYKMSMMAVGSVEFAYGFSYLCCMLMQVYLYCWFGNEVTLKSKQVGDAVYEMDWTTLPVNVIRDLLIVMVRCTRPIQMSSGHIVTLSAESFMGIMKASYSSYNLLKDS